MEPKLHLLIKMESCRIDRTRLILLYYLLSCILHYHYYVLTNNFTQYCCWIILINIAGCCFPLEILYSCRNLNISQENLTNENWFKNVKHYFNSSVFCPSFECMELYQGEVVLHQIVSSFEGHFVFHQRSFSINGHLPFKVAFHRRIVFHSRTSSIEGYPSGKCHQDKSCPFNSIM